MPPASEISLEPGTVIELGSYTLLRDEIVAFGRAYDPHPFHIDEVAAADTPIGELIASGIQVLAVWQRLAYRDFFRHLPIVAGLGMDRMRLRKVTRPDTRLSGTVEILAIDPHRSGRRVMRNRGTLVDHDGDLVLEFLAVTLLDLRT